MTNRKAAAITTPVAGEPAEFQLVDRIGPDTRGVLVLFPFTPKEFDREKTYPVMTGHLDTKNAKVPVSAFKKLSEEGREFLSLSIGRRGQTQLGGALFRQEEQNGGTGLWERTPGKELDRFGVLSKQTKVGDEEYQLVYQLRIYGRARMTDAGVPYIKCRVYPERREGSGNAFASAENFF